MKEVFSKLIFSFPFFAEASLPCAYEFGSDAFVAECDLCQLSQADFAALVSVSAGLCASAFL